VGAQVRAYGLLACRFTIGPKPECASQEPRNRRSEVDGSCSWSWRGTHGEGARVMHVRATDRRRRTALLRPPNKGMKLTSAEHIERSQLIPGVRRTSLHRGVSDVEGDARGYQWAPHS
jgi:hypothetical protein